MQFPYPAPALHSRRRQRAASCPRHQWRRRAAAAAGQWRRALNAAQHHAISHLDSTSEELHNFPMRRAQPPPRSPTSSRRSPVPQSSTSTSFGRTASLATAAIAKAARTVRGAATTFRYTRTSCSTATLSTPYSTSPSQRPTLSQPPQPRKNPDQIQPLAPPRPAALVSAATLSQTPSAPSRTSAPLSAILPGSLTRMLTFSPQQIAKAAK